MYKCLNDKLYENNIDYLLNTIQNTSIFRAIGLKNVYFKPNDNVTIRIEVDKENDEQLKKNADMCKQILETSAFPFINLNFQWVDNTVPIPNIRIIIAKNGSIVGGVTAGIGKQNSLVYIFNFNQGTVLHEFAHTLGRYHEHLNPNNNPIKWIKDKVYTYYQNKGLTKEQIDTQILRQFDPDVILTTPFDEKSVMNYDIVSSLTENGITIHRGNEYSEGDKLWFKLQYGSK
jgi:phenylacetate-coenzyme A ligase PaaK-like adenylate-forming protein